MFIFPRSFSEAPSSVFLLSLPLSPNSETKRNEPGTQLLRGPTNTAQVTQAAEFGDVVMR